MESKELLLIPDRDGPGKIGCGEERGKEEDFKLEEILGRSSSPISDGVSRGDDPALELTGTVSIRGILLREDGLEEGFDVGKVGGRDKFEVPVGFLRNFGE